MNKTKPVHGRNVDEGWCAVKSELNGNIIYAQSHILLSDISLTREVRTFCIYYTVTHTHTLTHSHTHTLTHSHTQQKLYNKKQMYKSGKNKFQIDPKWINNQRFSGGCTSVQLQSNLNTQSKYSSRTRATQPFMGASQRLRTDWSISGRHNRGLSWACKCRCCRWNPPGGQGVLSPSPPPSYFPSLAYTSTFLSFASHSSPNSPSYIWR